MGSEETGTQRIALQIAWRGGRGIDVVSIVHNEVPIPYDPRAIRVDPGLAIVEYEIPAVTRHDLRLVIAFIGETRTDLALDCYVDGRHVMGPVCRESAEHRWEIRCVWSRSGRLTVQPDSDRPST